MMNVLCKQDCKSHLIILDRSGDKERNTVLLRASVKEHLDCVKACQTAGIHVDANCKCGDKSPLYWAIEHNNDDCIEFLLQAGAKVHDEVLHVGGKKGSERCVNLIIEAGGDPEEILCYAAYYGRIDIVELLLKKGVDVNKNGSLVYAAASGSVKCVNMLLEVGSDVNIISNPLPCYLDGNFFLGIGRTLTALFAASKSGSLECVTILLKAGADVKMKDKYDFTALLGAVDSSSVQCVDVLLRAGADVNIRNDGSKTALFPAVRAGSVQCIDALVKAGADVNITNVDGNTLLFHNWDIVDYYPRLVNGIKGVLDHGIKVNVKNN